MILHHATSRKAIKYIAIRNYSLAKFGQNRDRTNCTYFNFHLNCNNLYVEYVDTVISLFSTLHNFYYLNIFIISTIERDWSRADLHVFLQDESKLMLIPVQKPSTIFHEFSWAAHATQTHFNEFSRNIRGADIPPTTIFESTSVLFTNFPEH